jgi:hypothetical protein
MSSGTGDEMASLLATARAPSRSALIAVHHARKEVGFRNKSSSRCKSLVVMRSGCVVGVGIGKVKGKREESSSSEGLFSATEGILDDSEESSSGYRGDGTETTTNATKFK